MMPRPLVKEIMLGRHDLGRRGDLGECQGGAWTVIEFILCVVPQTRESRVELWGVVTRLCCFSQLSLDFSIPGWNT